MSFKVGLSNVYLVEILIHAILSIIYVDYD